MGEIKIIFALHDMIGIFVAERETDAQHLAMIADDVKPDDFDFFATIVGVGRQLQVFFRRHDPMTIALVEPFRRHTDFTGLRLAAFHAPLKHFHGVAHVAFGFLHFRVHGIARGGAAQMR